MAHVRQSRPGSGLGFQVQVLKNLSGCPLFARKRLNDWKTENPALEFMVLGLGRWRKQERQRSGAWTSGKHVGVICCRGYLRFCVCGGVGFRDRRGIDRGHGRQGLGFGV